MISMVEMTLEGFSGHPNGRPHYFLRNSSAALPWGWGAEYASRRQWPAGGAQRPRWSGCTGRAGRRLCDGMSRRHMVGAGAARRCGWAGLGFAARSGSGWGGGSCVPAWWAGVPFRVAIDAGRGGAGIGCVRGGQPEIPMELSAAAGAPCPGMPTALQGLRGEGLLARAGFQPAGAPGTGQVRIPERGIVRSGVRFGVSIGLTTLQATRDARGLIPGGNAVNRQEIAAGNRGGVQVSWGRPENIQTGARELTEISRGCVSDFSSGCGPGCRGGLVLGAHGGLPGSAPPPVSMRPQPCGGRPLGHRLSASDPAPSGAPRHGLDHQARTRGLLRAIAHDAGGPGQTPAALGMREFLCRQQAEPSCPVRPVPLAEVRCG